MNFQPPSSHLPTASRLFQHFAAIGLLSAAGFAAGYALLPQAYTPSIALALVAVIGYVLFRLLKRIEKAEDRLSQLTQRSKQDADANFQQAEALISLVATIRPTRPLPPTRGWAMSPDILCQIANITLDHQPKVVLEASSGVSTLVIAYCLKQLGAGSVIALENDPDFAASTERNLRVHGLQEYARVVHAPLASQPIDGQSMRWYDLTAFDTNKLIDLFVIDGPPSVTEDDNQTRYPALPLLYDRLAPECRIVLDDASREGERQIIDSWVRQFPALNHRMVECEKGACIMIKNASQTSV